MAAELLAGAAAAGGSLLGSVANWGLNSLSAKKEREWNEQMMDKQNEWSLNMWNKTNEYNTPSAQFQRLKDAGLNPLYFGLDGSSANGLESAQALGYERAQAPMFDNPIAAGLDAYTQQKSLQKEIELKNAEIDKIKSDTAGKDLDNEWKDRTMEARVEAENLSNSLTKETINKVKKEMDVMEQDIKKKIAETNSEIERLSLIQAETALKRASEKEIVELLPYRELLMEAETDAQKASAAYSWAHAAYQRGLIDNGYLDALCREAISDAKIAANKEGISWNEARQSAAEADIEKFKSSVKNGTMFDNTKFSGKVFNGILSGVSAVSEALGGSLVPLVGAGIIGKGISSTKPEPAAPEKPAWTVNNGKHSINTTH